MNNGSYASTDLECGNVLMSYETMPESCNLLDIDNPGAAPGAHFKYVVGVNPPASAEGFYIVASRNTLDGGTDGAKICLGQGIEIYCEKTPSYGSAWLNDGKLYWNSHPIYQAIIPKGSP